MSFLSNFTKQIQSGLEEGLKQTQKLSNDFTPIAKRTARLVQEKFGTIEDISELPADYILLEKKVDALKNVYKKIILITSTYEIDDYDYPPNIRESVSDLSKTITERFSKLQKAKDTTEVQEALTTSTDSTPPLPKTLAHEISKATKQSHDILVQLNENNEENSLSTVLLKFSQSQSKIGYKRLEQDKLIIEEFNKKLQKSLDDHFTRINADRRKVETARLNFDTLRYEVKVNPERKEELQEKLDNAEDELVNATVVAAGSMKKLIAPAESINLFILFNKIQLEYHKSVTTELESLIKDLENTPIEDEDEDDEEEEVQEEPEEQEEEEATTDGTEDPK